MIETKGLTYMLLSQLATIMCSWCWTKLSVSLDQVSLVRQGQPYPRLDAVQKPLMPHDPTIRQHANQILEHSRAKSYTESLPDQGVNARNNMGRGFIEDLIRHMFHEKSCFNHTGDSVIK